MHIFSIAPHGKPGLGNGFNDSPEATRVMHQIPDPLIHARHFRDNPPSVAMAVDDPWWWAVLALGADCINVHFDCRHRGPLALVSRPQARWHKRRDVEALEAILKGQGRPTFDAWRSPEADGKIVGLVEVVDCVADAKADSLWFVGPYALKVEKQCLLPIGRSGAMVPAGGILGLNRTQQDSILYGLSGMANRMLQPGKQS